jgi:hypothetical protein
LSSPLSTTLEISPWATVSFARFAMVSPIPNSSARHKEKRAQDFEKKISLTDPNYQKRIK